ncbi:hypothetical protein DRE_04523 [Drechslerella stenobrocha 248]|uniref:Velvet domain-containing protein n=1 Tax=Drechslerella stenobrocha 248 TaxID=1043628 RepID=W7I1F9_9PEZI|nr:hypothetical protein DRE_04523 [Drechslerella stenobrocha 248]
MPPRRAKVLSEREMSQSMSQTVGPLEHSQKKRRLDPDGLAPATTPRRRAGSIKMDASSQQPLRRSARLQQASNESRPQTSTSAIDTTTSSASIAAIPATLSERPQRTRAKTLSQLPKTKETKQPVKRRQAAAEQATASSPKRRRRKSTSARRDQVPSISELKSSRNSHEADEADNDEEQNEILDSDGVLWTKMPFSYPQDIYNFSAEFYIPPPRTVEVNADVGPPPIIVRLHIVDKQSGQEVPYDNDPERYYWTVARVLHEDHTLAPEFRNRAQTSETPMSWFHEEQEEDTRTPVTRTPPPGGPVRRWKTFVTFPNIQIPATGRYRIQIALGVYIDQKMQTEDGREKVEQVCKELVATTSDVIVVQEEEPKDDDDLTAELQEKKYLYDKLLAERDDFFRRQSEQDESF